MFNLDTFELALRAPARLAVLDQLVSVSSVASVAFGRTARIAQAALHGPLVLISFIAPDRLHVNHQIGLPTPWDTEDTLALDVSYCPYVILSPTAAVLVDSAHTASVEPVPRLSAHGYVSSVSVPLLTSDGHVIGALTVADTHARVWIEREVGLLRELAADLVSELELHLRLSSRTPTLRQLSQEEMPSTPNLGNGLVNPVVQQREQIFQAISDTSPVGVVLMNVDGYVIYVNQQLQNILGRTPNNILGVYWSTIIHHDDCERVVNEWLAQPMDAEQLMTEYRVVRPDNEVRWIRCQHSWLRDHNGALIGHVGALEDITAHREVEDALRTSELRFGIAVDQFPYTFIIYDADLRIQFVNHYGRQRSGYAYSDVLGRTDTDLFPESNTNAYLPLLRKARDTRSTQSGQITIRFPDGVAHILVTYVPILGVNGAIQQILAITYDVTTHQETAELLRRSEERYRLLFESNPQPMWVFDQQSLAFLAVNEAALQHYGYSSDEFLSMTIKDIRPEEDVMYLMHTFDNKQLPQMTPLYARHYKRDGTLIDVEIRGHQFAFDGRSAILVLINDITERLRAESERQALERKLQETQKLESLGLLAGGIAHDFNNLLSAIMGNAGMALLDLSAANPAYEAVQQIELASRRAADLTQQMLAYAGRGYFTVQPLDLNSLVVEMTSLLGTSISKTVEIRYQLAHQLPVVEADKTQLRQVVMNIVINASEAIGEADGVITLRTGVDQFDELRLAATAGATIQPGRYVYLEVTDTGCGIDRNTITRIFDPFYTTKFVGRGLGLAAVQGIVRRHKGGLLVRSILGQGTTFTMLLPVADNGVIDDAPAPPQTEILPKQRGSVLVVDDEESVRKLCARVLERAGYAVITAHDGQAGIAAFRHNLDTISFVLLDLTMPHMNGEQVLRAIRELRPNIQVVLTSGYNEHDITGRFHELGAIRFMQKPFTPQQLLQLTRQAFDDHADGGTALREN